MDKTHDIAKRNEVDTIIHLAALLSATAEKSVICMEFKYGRTCKCIRSSRELNCKFFTPSSIGAFGPSTPKDNTPQDTIQRPTTMYG